MPVDKSIFLTQFKQETEEHLQQMINAFLRLEHDPQNRDILNEVFRSAHTLKGSSTMMGFTDIRDVAHEMENVLDAARNKNLTLTSNSIDVLFEALDTIKALLEATLSGTPAAVSISDSLKKLKGLLFEPQEETAVPFAMQPAEDIAAPSSQAPQKAEMEEMIRVEVGKLDELLNLAGELIISESRLEECIKELGKLRGKIKDVSQTFKHLKEEQEEGGVTFYESLTAQEEVSSTLEKAITLQEQFLDVTENLREAKRKIDVFTHQIQAGVLKIRMLPLSTVFDPMYRLVRDTSKEVGKRVSLVPKGWDTELDKRIIDEIQDPLIHIIRNAIDHGIELPDDRERMGKPREGKLMLSAYSRGSQVVIESEDDGRGIDTEVIKRKALEMGLVTESYLEGKEKEEIYELMFLPGFSTAASVSKTSGRGVGLDAVKEKVEKLKGSIEIKSEPRKGTRFTIRLPLTLSLTEVLLVRTSGQLFALPLGNIEEMVRIERKFISTVSSKETISLRDELIPLVKLSAVLKLPSLKLHQEESFPVVIAGSGEKRVGFLVDELVGKQEIVIKSLGTFLQRVPNVAGATILGHGEIVPILDVPGLITASKQVARDHGVTKETGKGQQGTSSPIPAVEMPKARHRVLAAEDSLTARELMRSILEAAGLDVEVAVDGLDAWEKLRRGKFDLLITDVEMPRMDGFELISSVRREEGLKHIPAIVVSTRDSEDDKRRGISVGADAYIVKSSFDQKDLMKWINRLLG